MRSTLLRISILILVICPLFSAPDQKQISLPIRIIKTGEKSPDWNKNDLELRINGSSRQIAKLIRQERSLSRHPDLGRQIILSFHNIKKAPPIQNALSFLFSEILVPADSLILLSPLKAYRISVTEDKEKMILDVMKILDQDCSNHDKSRISAERNLDAELQRLKSIAAKGEEDFFSREPENSEQVLIQASNLASNYKAIYQVLLNFPQNFSQFKNQFLIPNISDHGKIGDFLEDNHGEKWWIHFHHREDIQIVQKAKSAGRLLSNYIATHETGELARTMNQSLANLEKQLLISEALPQEEILETLLGKNITYNVVSWGSINHDDSNTAFKETSDLDAALQHVVEYSGGKFFVTTDPEQGIKEIARHTDRYYDLIFDFNGTTEEKNLEISVNNANIHLSHKKKLSQEEVDEWIRRRAEKKVGIENFSQTKHTVQFGIDSFAQDRKNKIGMIKVRISLFSSQDVRVYESENTLRASKEKVTISIPLSPDFKGKFRLRIDVFDLLANKAASSDYLIELE